VTYCFQSGAANRSADDDAAAVVRRPQRAVVEMFFFFFQLSHTPFISPIIRRPRPTDRPAVTAVQPRRLPAAGNEGIGRAGRASEGRGICLASPRLALLCFPPLSVSEFQEHGGGAPAKSLL